MRPSMPGRHQLTELQLAILRVIWDRSEATVQDVWEALHAERGLAQTTVATMLSRLERHGVVTRRRRLEPAASDLLWKVALLASLVTGTIQSRLELSTPAAVTLPVATLPQAARPNEQAGATGPGRKPGVSENTGASVTAPSPSRAPSLPLVVVLVWGVIALGSSLHYVARRLILVGRLTDRRTVSDGPLAATLAELQRTAGYRRRVHLTMARTISSPVALGLSEICVPELALSDLGAEQQRSMLAHELAHLARRDSLWLAGASLIERCFFFQPLNRLARRELETTAEYLRDE